MWRFSELLWQLTILILRGTVIQGRKTEAPTPVYYKLQSEIKDKIERGKWKPGVMIPPERVFVEEHRVSIGTVKKAITNLVNEGFLYRIQGKGTFVTDTQSRRNRLRYYRLFKDFSDEESDLRFKLSELKIVNGWKPIRHMLRVRSNQKLIRIKRSMIASGSPLIFSTSFLPEKLFKGLERLPKSHLESQPLYTYLEEHYDVPTIYNQELISAVGADPETSKQLDVPEGTPLLLIEMLSFTYKDKPYEYRISFCRTDSKKVFRSY